MLISARVLPSLLLRGYSGLHPHLKLRPHFCTCCHHAVQMPACDLALPNQTRPLDSFYTPEQQATILKLLNTGSEIDLAGVKLLRGQKLNSIIEYRTRNGPFKDLESVANVPMLKHKSAVIVFNSILNPKEQKGKRKQKLQFANYIKPVVTKTHLEAAADIVSIVAGINSIAWTHMDQKMNVLAWQQQQCQSFLNGSYFASSYLEDVSAVVSNLPAADLYVVEKPVGSFQNVNLFPIIAHLRTVEAMLFALLSAPKTPDSGPKVLNMTRQTVGRHFGLMVATSRTSSAQTVMQMMTRSVTEKSPRVRFPSELLVRYQGVFQMSSRNTGEELCDALLQAVAFYELLRD
ncbi:transcription elongation factor, mitochondrial [Salminus brasiliensis]|uniref:transcription elongation factor, mitochondrial n=1 Tax=Salminus brasiliensis TaxID=930266 RepID=UPI003B82F88E